MDGCSASLSRASQRRDVGQFNDLKRFLRQVNAHELLVR
jgi:hypothetical protein